MKSYQIKPLLIPDGADGAAEVDPLSGAASGVEPPKFPVLAPERLCDFKINKCTKEPVKDTGRFSLTFQLKTAKDYTDKDGKPLREGFTVYHRIGLSPTAEEGKRERTYTEIRADLCVVLRCVGMGDKQARDLVDNPSMVEGHIVTMKVGIQPAKDGYPESNRLTFVEPA